MISCFKRSAGLLIVISLLVFALALSTAYAGTLHVSISNGKNKNAGTKDAPMKNLDKAIKKAKAGDAAAFEKLVKMYDRRVYALALDLMGNQEDAKDVYQEVFLKVYRALPKFRFHSDFFTWLYRIVVNCCYTQRRKRARNRHLSIEEHTEDHTRFSLVFTSTDPLPDEETMQNEMIKIIEEQLDDLTIQQRAIFILRFSEQFKLALHLLEAEPMIYYLFDILCSKNRLPHHSLLRFSRK